MRIIVNGNQTDASDGASVESLIAAMSLPASRVAVELNKLLVPRSKHAQTALAEGDVLEIVTLVGGG